MVRYKFTRNRIGCSADATIIKELEQSVHGNNNFFPAVTVTPSPDETASRISEVTPQPKVPPMRTTRRGRLWRQYMPQLTPINTTHVITIDMTKGSGMFVIVRK